MSRELQRNAQALGDASASAYTACLHRRLIATPPSKLHADGVLYGIVGNILGLCWSPEQIVLKLACIYPKCHEHRMSHESIYNCIYAQRVGELTCELIGAQRHTRNKRVPRYKGRDHREQTPEIHSIHLRPPETEELHLPGHCEGDLIKGAATPPVAPWAAWWSAPAV